MTSGGPQTPHCADREEQLRFRLVQCMVCEHLRKHSRCDAFPEGIPAPLRTGKLDHRFAYPGDHGIRFAHIQPPERCDWYEGYRDGDSEQG
jgi:hypothetical protein